MLLSPSLASQTLTLHSVLVLSGKTRGGRVWPTAYTCLDPARQDVWPIRFVENMITSRSMFILRIAGKRRRFLEVDLPFGHFLVSKSSVACSGCFFVLPWLPFSSEILNYITQLNVTCREIMDPNGHRQWARPSPRVFILKELNAAECEGLAYETNFLQQVMLAERLHAHGSLG